MLQKERTTYRPLVFYQDLILKILDIYRGKLSRIQLSEKLGYSYNVVHRWETRKKRISWQELLKVVELKKGLNLRKIVDEFHGDPKNFGDICNYIIPEKFEIQIEKLQTISLVDRRTLKKWLLNEGSPPAEFIFLCFDTFSTESFLDLIQFLVDPTMLDTIKSEFSLIENARLIFSTNNLTALVAESLSLDLVTQSPDKVAAIAQYLNLDKVIIKKEIEKLVSLGWIIENQEQSYIPNHDRPMNLFPTNEQALNLASFIAELAKQRIDRKISPPMKATIKEKEQSDSTDYLSYWISAVSSDCATKIHKIAAEYNKKIIDTLKDDRDVKKDLLTIAFFEFFEINQLTNLKGELEGRR